VVTATSTFALSFGNTGSGVFARRSASVLPPPSRFACARMSAFAGADFDFALTSATSSGGPRSSILRRSNGWNRIARTSMWIAIEMSSAETSSRLPRSIPSTPGNQVTGSAREAGTLGALGGAGRRGKRAVGRRIMTPAL
jgi:hypothetical protein